VGFAGWAFTVSPECVLRAVAGKREVSSAVPDAAGPAPLRRLLARESVSADTTVYDAKTAWSYEPQLLGTAPEYGATIYRCRACGAYWEEGLTYPRTIAREEAVKMLPWLADEESAGPDTGDRS